MILVNNNNFIINKLINQKTYQIPQVFLLLPVAKAFLTKQF